MARPQVADRGGSLLIWRLAANILNKQSRAADKGSPSMLWAGRADSSTSPQKNKLDTNCYKGPRTWTNFLDKRPKLKKMDMQFGTWNV
jgi:hypothetical protein